MEAGACGLSRLAEDGEHLKMTAVLVGPGAELVAQV
jgi:hypothetical protein